MRDTSIIELSYNFDYNVLSTNKNNSYTAAKNSFKFKKLYDTAKQTCEGVWPIYVIYLSPKLILNKLYALHPILLFFVFQWNVISCPEQPVS